MKKILDLITHEKTAIAYVAVAVLVSIADGLVKHHVDWCVVGAAACAAGASMCKSLLPSDLLATLSTPSSEPAEPPEDASKN